MIWLGYNAFSIACVAGAVALLIAGVDFGWGWLLVLGALTAVTPAGGQKCSCSEDKE